VRITGEGRKKEIEEQQIKKNEMGAHWNFVRFIYPVLPATGIDSVCQPSDQHGELA